MKKKIFEKKKADSIDFILEISYAFKKSRVLFTACEFDIFSIIGEKGFSSEQISAIIDADKVATERLLNSLCAMNLLFKKDEYYFNTDISKKHLVTTSKEFIGNLEFIASTWDTWSNLSQTIKTGKSINLNETDQKLNKIIDNFASAAFWRASVEAADIVDQIETTNVKRILDLGGGKGAFAKAFVEANPNVEVTIFDIPQIAEDAKANIQKWGLTDKIKVIEGDFTKDDIGKNYDMIFISKVIQLYSIWDNIKLLQKCFDATFYGGQVVINELVIDDNRTSPINHTLTSLNLLLSSKGGDTYTETDLWIMLREAWFRNITRIETPFETTLMVGVR